MRVLIIYQLRGKIDRNTIYEHLYSFEKYSPQHHFHYLNVFDKVPSFIFNIRYDAVILHYTFLAGERFLEEIGPWQAKTQGLEKLTGYKIAIPQDEYDHTDRLCELFRRISIDLVCTCFTNDGDIRKAYPETIVGKPTFLKVFTGYVDDKTVAAVKGKAVAYKKRPIDVGYRARKLPAYFGKHGQLKYELVGLFNDFLSKTALVYDINNTNQDATSENLKVVKLGNSWLEFLISCKAFIGCEGGSSLLDFDGSIKSKVIEYTKKRPDASFEEIEKACFPGLDYNISCFAISPRHFEAAATKTLQILVEGNYGGAFIPWKHYIPLKRDFSNIAEVVQILSDEEFCQNIIDNAYEDIVKSGMYSYAKFVNEILTTVTQNAGERKEKRSYFVSTVVKVVIKLRNYSILEYYYLRSLLWKVLYKDFYEIYIRPYVRGTGRNAS